MSGAQEPSSENRFALSERLSAELADIDLESGRTLRDALRLRRRISLWDVVETYLVLYRFPLHFSPAGVPTHRDGSATTRRHGLAYQFRPYRGLVARLRDLIVSSLRKPLDRCSEWPLDGRKVLFVCFTPTFYRDVLHPVADAVVTRGLAGAVVLSDKLLAGAATQGAGGVSFQSPWEHGAADAISMRRSMRAAARRVGDEFLAPMCFNQVMQELRGSFGDVDIRNELRWLFWREFPRLIPFVVSAEHLLVQHRPALIVSADDADQRCRIYSLLGRVLGIPTLLVQQGLSLRHYPEWRFLSHDRVAAMGGSSRADMVAQGVDPDRIVVTGHPGFDRFVESDRSEALETRKRLGLAHEGRVLLFASQPSYVGAFDQPQRRIEMLAAVAEIASVLEDVTVVIKPHPGETRHDLMTVVGSVPRVVVADESEDIAPLIRACDVFVTFYSTTALQALYAHKPVITIDVPGAGGGRLYAESGATWIARSPDELRGHVTLLLSAEREALQRTREEARTRFLFDMVHTPDGRAADRVADVVADMLSQRQTFPSSMDPAQGAECLV